MDLPPGAHVLDVGGRDINGTPRDLFPPGTMFLVVDAMDGPGVDIVADAAEWDPGSRRFDVVVSTETFEHAARWREILAVMVGATKIGGFVVITAACDPRGEHSAIDGGGLRPGEWYGNVDPDALQAAMADLGCLAYTRVHPRGDVYALGRTAE